MPQYNYTAVDIQGKKTTGVLEAANLAQLGVQLKEKGLFVIEAMNMADIKYSKEIGAGKKVKVKPLAVFCRQFSTLINAGITAVKALDILYQQTDDKNLKMLTLHESYTKTQHKASVSLLHIEESHQLLQALSAFPEGIHYLL